jgi:hypothetical protein
MGKPHFRQVAGRAFCPAEAVAAVLPVRERSRVPFAGHTGQSLGQRHRDVLLSQRVVGSLPGKAR